MKRRAVLALLLAFFAYSSVDARFIRGGGPNQGTPTQGWSILPIGAGGLFTGVSFANDGTKYARNNTYGAHYYNPATTNCGNGSRTGCWQQCLTTASMPGAQALVSNGDIGADEIMTYALDGSKVYMLWRGFLFYSADHCGTFAQTPLPTQTYAPNGIGGFNGPWLAVDPQNPDFVYVGTLGNGIYFSTNGTLGATSTWAQVSTGTVPAGTGNGVLVAFDPHSSVVSGKTQIIYAAVNGVGMYQSTNGGGAWTKISGSGTGTTGLTTFTRLKVNPLDGNVWVTDGGGGTWKLVSGTWTNVTLASAQAAVPDPGTANRIVAVNGQGQIAVSLNSGTSWTAFFAASAGSLASGCTDLGVIAADIPWTCNSNEIGVSNGFTTADMTFDPSTSNLVVLSEGIDLWTANPPNTASNFSWTSIGAATENLVGQQVIQSPGCSRPIVTAWDRSVYYAGSDTQYPSSIGANYGTAIVFGTGADWASASNTTLVGVFTSNNNNVDYSGYSSNCGQTWTPFGTTSTTSWTIATGSKAFTVPSCTGLTSGTNTVAVVYASGDYTYQNGRGSITSCVGTTLTLNITAVTGSNTSSNWVIHTIPDFFPSLIWGGGIAASSSTNFVWFPSTLGGAGSGNVPYYTTNGGLTWNLCTFPASVPTTGNTGWVTNSYADPQIVTADRVNASTFYAYNNNVNNAGTDGVYKSTDGGATWTSVASGVMNTGSGVGRLRSVPGNAGHLFLSKAEFGDAFKFSNDAGVTWTQVTDSAGALVLNGVLAYGIGATYPSQSYPALFAAGNRNSVYGAWRGTDFNPATAVATFTNMGGGYPNNSFDYPYWVEGDMNNVGRLYYAFAGSGFARGQFNFLLKRDLDPASNDNDPMWLEKAA